MEILNKLISEGVVPYDVANQLKEQFETKVQVKANEMCEAFKQELSEKTEKSIGAFMELIKENAEKTAQQEKALLESKLSDYMDIVVENFIKENKSALETKLDETRIKALLEGFNAMLIAGGVELKEIQEELDESKAEKVDESESLKNQIDSLANDLHEKQKLITFYQRKEVFNKLCEGLSDLQKDKMLKFADDVSINESLETFENQMRNVKETLEEAAEVKYEKIGLNESFGITANLKKDTNNTALLFSSSLFNK